MAAELAIDSRGPGPGPESGRGGREFDRRLHEIADEVLRLQYTVKLIRCRIIVLLGFLGITSALWVIGFALAVTATMNLLALFEEAEVNSYLLCALFTGILLLALFTAELLASMAWTDGHTYHLSNALTAAGERTEEVAHRQSSSPLSSFSSLS